METILGPSWLLRGAMKGKAPPAGHDVAGPRVRGRLKRWQAPGEHLARGVLPV